MKGFFSSLLNKSCKAGQHLIVGFAGSDFFSHA